MSGGVEWCEEVQGLLERDAGWGWKGFWEMVRDNLKVCPALRAAVLTFQSPRASERLRPPREMTDRWVREVIEKYKRRREWVLLQDVRSVVETIERWLVRGRESSEPKGPV